MFAEIDAAEEAGQAAKAEQLRKQRRGELIRKLRQLQRRNVATGKGKQGAGSGSKMTRAEVAEPDVARIISQWTGRGRRRGGRWGEAGVSAALQERVAG